MTVLETDRCNIRRISEKDYDEMFEVYSDLELMRFVGDSSAISPEDCRRWIGITEDNYQTRGYGLFLIEDKHSKDSIGFIGLTHPDGIPNPEIKYTLKKPYWGKGLATELVSVLTRHALQHKWTSKVVATVDPDNTASHRVLLKSGFTRQPDICNGDGTITAYYSCEAP